MINIAEWFGGIGAGTQGMKRVFKPSLINVHDYVEKDKHAVKSYNAINGTNFVPTDINDIDTKNYPELDLIIAGWPCQDYSIAGKGAGLEGSRSSLILLTIEKIRDMINKPKHILLENVKGLLSKRHEADLKYIKDLFDELGYNWNQATLNAKYFGIPQARERVFMILTRKDLPMKRIDHLEQKNSIDTVLMDFIDLHVPPKYMDIAECIKNKNVIMKDGKHVWKTSNGSTRSLFEIKGENETINIPHANNYTNCVLSTLGGISTTLMANSPRYLFIGMDRYTVAYRPLTAKECWRLMGFKEKDYNICKVAGVSVKQLAKQAGNSIVVNVLEAIFKEVWNGN